MNTATHPQSPEQGKRIPFEEGRRLHVTETSGLLARTVAYQLKLGEAAPETVVSDLPLRNTVAFDPSVVPAPSVNAPQQAGSTQPYGVHDSQDQMLRAAREAIHGINS